MLKITGKLITIKNKETAKGRKFKRLQLLVNGEQDTVRVENVKDYKNRDYSAEMGEEVELDVFAFPWVGKSGVAAIDYVMI